MTEYLSRMLKYTSIEKPSLQFSPPFSGAVHEEFEEADEEDQEHDIKRHGHHPAFILLVCVAGPSSYSLQCGARILPNFLQ